MARPNKTIFFAYLILKFFQFLGKKFYDLAADITNHVVVMRMTVGMLVNIALISPCDPFDKTTLHKQA